MKHYIHHLCVRERERKNKVQKSSHPPSTPQLLVKTDKKYTYVHPCERNVYFSKRAVAGDLPFVAQNGESGQEVSTKIDDDDNE